MAQNITSDNERTYNRLRKVDNKILKGRYEGLLLRKAWKQADLAREVGCDEALISRVVNGKESPSPTLLIKIAKALDVDSSVLLYDEFQGVFNDDN